MEPCKKFGNVHEFIEGEDEGTTCTFLIRRSKRKKKKGEMVRDQASRKNQSMAGGWLLLFGRVSENLLIMVVEAGQELVGPPGRRLHHMRLLIVGR